MMRLIRLVTLLCVQVAAAMLFQQTLRAQAEQLTNPAGAAANTGQPFPALTPQQQSRLDQLLAAWEQSSSATQRLQASFQRWQYRPLQAPNEVHATWAKGEVKYQAPAEGMYFVSDMRFFSGFDDKKAPIYNPNEKQPGEWWICNGKELLEFDRANKKCEILELPPEMQGTQIVSSPLPFVFNLNKNEMNQRYWIQELPPKQEGEFWLEAWPKNQQDRAEFKKVMIVIDAKQFLPKAMILFPPNFDPRTNAERDVYEFTDVQRNGNLLDKLAGVFGRNFINAKPPADWQVIRKQFIAPGAPQVAQQPGQAPAAGNPTNR